MLWKQRNECVFDNTQPSTSALLSRTRLRYGHGLAPLA
jgi:hypothetical protein